MVRALPLLVLAGCSQIFGLDEGRVDDAPVIDADPTDARDPTDAASELTVTGDYVHRYARNPPSGALPVLDVVELGPAQPLVSVMFEDGSSAPVSVGAGTFSFTRHTLDQPYLVTIDEAGVVTRYQHTAAALHAVRRTAGRLAPRLPRTPSALTWTTQPGSRVGFVATTGQWSHTIANIVGASTVRRLLWDKAAATGGTPLGDLDATEGDITWTLETASNGTYAAVVMANRMAISTQGQPAVALPAPTALMVPPTRCTFINSANKEALDRLQPVVVRTATDIASDYRVLAVPFPDELSNLGEIWMALASPASVGNDTIAVDYPPVIPGHDYLASSHLQILHEISLSGATAIIVASQLRRFDKANDCTGTPPDLASRSGLPTDLSFGGTAIGRGSTPGMIALPAAGPIEIKWSLAGGAADYVSIQIFELTASAGATISRLVENIVAVSSPVWIPTENFTPGRSYVVGFATLRGYPGAATGDFDPVAYPSEFARIWSNTFVAGQRL